MVMSGNGAVENLFDPETAIYNRDLFVSDGFSASEEQVAAAENLLAERRRLYGWTQCTGSEKQALLKTAGVAGLTGRVWKKPLPFYKHAAGASLLLHVEDVNRLPEQARRILLPAGGEPITLNGTSPDIHETNKNMGGMSDSDPGAIEEYVSFFCEHVHGEEGAFHCIEEETPDADDPLRILSYDERRDLKPGGGVNVRVGFPITQIPQAADKEGWLFVASVVYGNRCFRSAFHVQPSGMIEMLDDKPLTRGIIKPVEPPWQPRKAGGGS